MKFLPVLDAGRNGFAGLGTINYTLLNDFASVSASTIATGTSYSYDSASIGSDCAAR